MNIENRKHWIKWHHWFFGGIIFAAMFTFMEIVQYRASDMFEMLEGEYWNIQPLNLNTIDYSIPMWKWMIIPYDCAVASWTIFPIFIYFAFGPRRFAKFLAISSIVFLCNFVLSISVYTTTKDMFDYFSAQLKDSTNFFDKLIMLGFKADPSGRGAFPSNHCTCQLLLCFSIVDFSYFTKDEGRPSKKSIWKNILVTLIVFYTAIVCASTFILKQHWFLDWVPALINVLFWNIVFYFFKKSRYIDWIAKIMINWNYAFKYINDFDYEHKYVTWGKKFQNKYLTNKKLNHFVIVDILTSIWFLIIVFANNFSVVGSLDNPIMQNFYNWLAVLSVIPICSLFYLVFLSCWKYNINTQKKKKSKN